MRTSFSTQPSPRPKAKVYNSHRYVGLRRWMSGPPNPTHQSGDSSEMVRVLDRVIDGTPTRAYVSQLYIDVEPEPLPSVDPRAIFISASPGSLPSMMARRAAHCCPDQYPLCTVWVLPTSLCGGHRKRWTMLREACSRTETAASASTWVSSPNPRATRFPTSKSWQSSWGTALGSDTRRCKHPHGWRSHFTIHLSHRFQLRCYTVRTA